jgi:hypothetical protein
MDHDLHSIHLTSREEANLMEAGGADSLRRSGGTESYDVGSLSNEVYNVKIVSRKARTKTWRTLCANRESDDRAVSQILFLV